MPVIASDSIQLKSINDTVEKANSAYSIATGTDQHFWHLSQVTYYLSTDTTVVSDKTYYTRSGEEGSYTYTEVTPVGTENPSTQNWYEKYSGTGAHITEVTQDEFLEDPQNGGGNLLARSNGIAIREGIDELAVFTADNLRLGADNENHININTSGLTVYDKDYKCKSIRYRVTYPEVDPEEEPVDTEFPFDELKFLESVNNNNGTYTITREGTSYYLDGTLIDLLDYGIYLDAVPGLKFDSMIVTVSTYLRPSAIFNEDGATFGDYPYFPKETVLEVTKEGINLWGNSGIGGVMDPTVPTPVGTDMVWGYGWAYIKAKIFQAGIGGINYMPYLYFGNGYTSSAPAQYGSYAAGFGEQNRPVGDYSMAAGGQHNEASGENSATLGGYWLNAPSDNGVAIGKVNDIVTAGRFAFTIGNGEHLTTSPYTHTASNAFDVEWNGETRLALDITATAGTTDGDLYAAILDAGWTNEVIE